MDGFGNCLLLLQEQLEAPKTHGWLILGVLAVIFIVPFLLGNVIARALKLNDLSGRIGVVLMTIFMALGPFAYQEIVGRLDEARVMKERAVRKENMKAGDPELIADEKPYVRRTWRDAIHWGIDLAGGTNLVYEVDLAAAKEQGKSVDKATLEKMVDAIRKRINPSGAEEVDVRRVGTDRIEVIIPGADPDLVLQKKNLIVKLGSLEFGIVATTRNDQALIDQASKLPPDINELRSKSGDESVIVAAWHDLTEKKDREREHQGVGFRSVPRLDRDGKEVKVPQLLIKHDPPSRAVTGSYLTNARATTDNNGAGAVSFTFNARGAALFHKLTSDNLPDKTDGAQRQLAILLDGKIQSAPVRSPAISKRLISTVWLAS
jgi:SecD/SecF fusion protein